MPPNSEFRSAISNPPTPWPAFAAWTLCAIALFHQPLWHLVVLARQDLHSHTLLIPFISAYLVYGERRRQPGRGVPGWIGTILLVAAALSLVVLRAPIANALAMGENGESAVLIFAFVAAIAAGGFLCLGARWMWAAAFPTAFLIFMVPLPGGWVEHLEYGLKIASADAAAWFFDFAAVPVLRDGVFFRLPGLTIEVAQECSGIRSTYVLFMTSLLASHIFLRSPWRRFALVAFIIPLGIIRNGFRILTLGWLCVQYGPHMIHTWIHHRGGPVFFALSLIPLFLLLWLLWWTERHRVPPRQSPDPTSDSDR